MLEQNVRHRALRASPGYIVDADCVLAEQSDGACQAVRCRRRSGWLAERRGGVHRCKRIPVDDAVGALLVDDAAVDDDQGIFLPSPAPGHVGDGGCCVDQRRPPAEHIELLIWQRAPWNRLRLWHGHLTPRAPCRPSDALVPERPRVPFGSWPDAPLPVELEGQTAGARDRRAVWRTRPQASVRWPLEQ